MFECQNWSVQQDVPNLIINHHYTERTSHQISRDLRLLFQYGVIKLLSRAHDTLTHCLEMLTSWPQRSRLQVTLSDLTSSCVFRSLRACQRHIKDTNSLNLAACNTGIGIYDVYISDFFISVRRWHQVISISWPLHYKSMVKKWSTVDFKKLCATF